MDALLARQSPGMPAPDLVAEANHRIANSLTLLVSMVRMQATSVKKKQAALSHAMRSVCCWMASPRASTPSANCTAFCREPAKTV